MDIKPGTRLRSQTCETEVLVIRVPAHTEELSCGGRPMVLATASVEASEPLAGFDTGTELGKRYANDGNASLEVLVTKGGKGTLSLGDVPMTVKAAKPLPSSD